MLIEFIVAESDTTWHTEIHDVPFRHDPATEIVGIWVYNSNPETEQETVDRLLAEKQAQKK